MRSIEEILLSPNKSPVLQRSSSATQSSASTRSAHDRFIPSRVSASAFEGLYKQATTKGSDEKSAGKSTPSKGLLSYLRLLGSTSSSSSSSNSFLSADMKEANKKRGKNILRFSVSSEKKKSSRSEGTFSPKGKGGIGREDSASPSSRYLKARCKESNELASSNNARTPAAAPRRIPTKAYKILELPDLIDDFYLQLLDWSSKDLMVVGLLNQTMVYSPSSNKNALLHSFNEGDNVSAVSFSQSGDHLAFTDSKGKLFIHDLNKKKIVRTIEAHSDRVGSLSWNGFCVATGSRDKKVQIFDVRQKESLLFINTFHKQEICGVKWAFDGDLLASGGNDNKVSIFSLKAGKEVGKLTQHTAAVKALAWSPHKANILASGGGTADRTIRLWDMQTMTQKESYDTGSQVCCLAFAKDCEELVSTHGYSLNQINLWRQKKDGSFHNMASLVGHSFRVLYLASSPCGERIATASGDETLRFWKLWEGLGRKSNLQVSNEALR